MVADHGPVGAGAPPADGALQSNHVVLGNPGLRNGHLHHLTLWECADQPGWQRRSRQLPHRPYFDGPPTVAPDSADGNIDHALHAIGFIVRNAHDRMPSDSLPTLSVQVVDGLQGDAEDERESGGLGSSDRVLRIEAVLRKLLA